MPFFGTTYVPPSVYVRTLYETPVSAVLSNVRIPVFVGTGNEILTQQDVEIIRGSSSAVDQYVPQEDMTGRAVVQITQQGQVILGDFNGDRRRVQVRNYPITDGTGAGRTATDPSSVSVTINGRPDVVLSVEDADIGVIELSTAPALNDEVRISYYFKRTDTQITDDVSEQVSPLPATLDSARGDSYEFTTSTNTFNVRVDDDQDQEITVSLGTGTKSPTTVVSLINGAAAGTSLIASIYTNNFGVEAIRLSADRDLEILEGSANAVLGFTTGQSTNRRKTFYVFNGPIVDGSNGGVTTTDVTKVEVRVDGTLVDATSVDGQNRAVTLPFAPEVGSEVEITYYFNAWQDTFDYLPNINVTSVVRCGIIPGNSDFVQGSDFVLKDDHIVWGTSVLISEGVTTGSTVFGQSQVSALLIDNRWYLAETTVVVDSTVSPPYEDRTKFQLPAQPTTGNGRNFPLGAQVFESIANDRIDLPTNNPSLVQAYWGFDLQDAIARGSVEVLEVEGTVITLKDKVPVGAQVWATFWYNILTDDKYTLQVETAGPSGIGSYYIFDKNLNPIFTPLFGVKGPALTGITLEFPSGSELTPDVHFEGGSGGPVEETITVTFAEKDATLAKYTFPGSGPYAFVTNASDRAYMMIDSASLQGGAAGISLTTPHGISGLGFPVSLLGEEVEYTIDSGLTTYDILEGINDQVSMNVDGVTLSFVVPEQLGVNVDAYVAHLNDAAKTGVNIPFYTAQTRFVGNTVITAGEYDTFTMYYTGVTNGASGPIQVTVPAGTYVSPSFLATAVQTAVNTAVGALPPNFDGLEIDVEANINGQLTFALRCSDTDTGTFATGTITSNSAVLNDSVTINGITLIGDLSQDPGGLNFDTGQARATIIPSGVLPGDTFTIDAGGGPIVITASGSQTPGGLDFNEGVQASGTLTVAGPIPGDTVTIAGITLTASGAQTPGGLDFDEGTRASGTADLTGVEYGDTITISGVTLTASNTQTPGGLDFNVGQAATGSIQANGIRPGDVVTLNGTALTAAGAQVGGAYNFNEGVQATGTVTTLGVLTGDTVIIGGVTLTAAGAQTPGGLNFNEGTKATGSYTVNAAPTTATLTINGLPLAPAGGPRTPGADDYDETLGSPLAIAADIAAAINDPLNSFATFITASTAGAAVNLAAVVPGAVGNGITTTSSDGTITAAAATLLGGVGDDNTVAASIAAAINDGLNGLSGTVSAIAALNVVTITSLTPGLVGNSITLISSNGVRLALSGANLAGGVGDDTTVASSLADAINDALNVPLPTTFVAVPVGDTVFLTAVTPGSGGNLLTLAASAPGRSILSGPLLTGGVGDDVSAASSLVAAIEDAGNGLVGIVVADNAGGTLDVVTIEAYTPGTGGNAITLASSNLVRITISGATLAGGVGDNNTVAASIAAAINDAGNGIVVTATAVAALNVVTITAVVPGNVGNLITLASSSSTRLLFSGLTLAGGIGTDYTVASSIVAAINDVANGLAVAVMADNDSGLSTTVTVWALTPGVAGNLFTLASSNGTRLAISGANFVGGATTIQVASSLVAAILDAGNGLTTIVTADNSAGTSNVIDVTAVEPGSQGNFITLATSTAVRLPISGATLTGGVGLGGGYLEFLDAPTPESDFSILAGISTDALPGGSQTKLLNADIARRFTVSGTSGRLIYDRIVLRSRIIPGTGSLTYHSQLAQTEMEILGTNAETYTGLAPKAAGLAGISATIQSASLFGEVGFKDGQVTTGTYGDARDGMPIVKFYAQGGVLPQNNVFKMNIDGKAFTVVFKTAAGGTIASGSSAEVPLGPASVANTVLHQIQTAATAAGLGAVIFQEGAGIRYVSELTTTDSAITVGNGNANTTLGLVTGATSTRNLVEPEVTASALMAQHSPSVAVWILDYANPTGTYFAAQALAGVERDTTAAEFLYIQSQANNFVGLGPSSNILILDALTNSWLRTGTLLLALSGEGSAGESGYQGFYVTSSDPIDGSGSANTSEFNLGVGQDGVIGQTYRDEVTGLIFTILPREGALTYPVNVGSYFTFEVRKLTKVNANIPVNSIPGIELLVTNTTNVTVGDTAFVETIERGGQEPVVGDSYFVTYNFQKEDSGYDTTLFTSLSAVVDNYGPIDPDHAVSLASYLATLNGAVLWGVKQVPKAPGSNQATVQSYMTAFDSLRGALSSGLTLDTITPLRGDSLELFQALRKHCEIQSEARFKSERTAIIGVSSGTQPTQIGNIAKALLSERMRLLYPDIVTLVLEDALGNRKTFLVDGTYLAAAMAGNRASPNIDVATPWIGQTGRLVGFERLARTLDEIQKNSISVQGVTVLEQQGSVIKVRDAFTTDMTNILTRLPTIRTIADEVQRVTRRDLERFIGIKNLPGVLSEITGQMTITMKTLKQEEIITAYMGISASTTADPTTIEATAAYSPVFPLKYILVTYNLRSSLGV